MSSNPTQEVLEIFYQLTTIPHGSKDTKQMLAFLQAFAKAHNYDVEIDTMNNLMAFKKSEIPQVCYQSHYDMVCVGVAAQNLPLKLIHNKKEYNNITQTWLKAQNSSLGADNGMGMAIMMYFMKKQVNAEFLFTNDEEIGMIGAKNLNIPIKSKILINLDSEVLGEITVGCAGGFDVTYRTEFNIQKVPPNWHYYILQSRNFAGGHSGLDINNPAPNYQNAILESTKFLFNTAKNYKESHIILINWQGGEKRNSIPLHSKLIFASQEKLTFEANDFFTITELKERNNDLLDHTNEIFLKTPMGIDFRILHDYLITIPIGVLDSEKDLVLNSLSLSHISFGNGILSLAFMGRANIKSLLDSNLENLKICLSQPISMQKSNSTEITVSEYYPPWERQGDYDSLIQHLQANNAESEEIKTLAYYDDSQSNFQRTLALMYQSIYQSVAAYNIQPSIVELHAGLECGILLKRFKDMGLDNIVALSIGPSINAPHSINESVWVESAGLIIEILESFMAKI